MSKAVNGDDEKLGFIPELRKIRRIGPKNIKDFDFANDVALLRRSNRRYKGLHLSWLLDR